MRSLKEVASEYCSWVERPSVRPDLNEWLPRILAELIHSALCISDDGLADAGAEGFQGPDYKQVVAALPTLPFQYYREVFDALDLQATDEPVIGDLYDDLADIYCDLSEGLFVYEHVSAAEAERYWRQSFRYHWGEHATGALRAFYCTHQHEPNAP